MQEVAEGMRQVLLVLDGRCAVGGDQVKSPQRGFRQVWRFTLNHFDGHNTQTPDIDLATILFARDHFGCHPVRRADHRVTLVVRVVDLSTEAKIG